MSLYMTSRNSNLTKMFEYLKIEGDYKKLDEEHPYKVNDLIGYINMEEIDNNKLNIKDLDEKDKVIFILESPHTNEIRELKPAVGNTGKKFLKCGKGIGLEIDTSNDKKNIAISNISNIPLQISAVINELANKEDYQIGMSITSLDQLRKFKKYKNKNDWKKEDVELFNEIIDYLIDDFNKRLKELIGELSPNKMFWMKSILFEW